MPHLVERKFDQYSVNACEFAAMNGHLDLIKNPRIEVISSASGLVEVNARIESLLGESSSEKIEFKDLK